jgi:predicted RNase H-like HicB family nuclease
MAQRNIKAATKTYAFKVIVESDGEAWSAYCPALLKHGGATWGATREEALQNIEEVVKMVVESLIEHGDPIPDEPAGEVQVFAEPLVAVTV